MNNGRKPVRSKIRKSAKPANSRNGNHRRRKKYFVKVSGDEHLNPKFLSWIKRLSARSYVVICVGGGTQINEEFERLGIRRRKHGPLGREIPTFELRQIARDILERNQALLEDALAKRGIHVHVAIPVIEIGGVLCHVNGDLMVRLAYLGYDKLWVVTKLDRIQAKLAEFAGLKKVRIKAFA